MLLQYLLSCSTLLAKKAVKEPQSILRCHSEILQKLVFVVSPLFSRTPRLNGRRGHGGVEVQDVASILTRSPRYNQTICAREQCSATSDISTGLYVTGSRVLTLSLASSPHCTSNSLHICCRSTALTRPFGPLWEKAFQPEMPTPTLTL